MDGLLLRLSNDTKFWRCFEPVRGEFERYFWVFTNQPWMGRPEDFDDEREMMEYEGIDGSGVGLWRPGALGRWADRFCEEFVELWAVDPRVDAADVVSRFSRTVSGEVDAFIEAHGLVWLIYTDSTCWEVFAKEPGVLDRIRDHHRDKGVVRVFETSSADRGRGFAVAGIADVWRAMQGKY